MSKARFFQFFCVAVLLTGFASPAQADLVVINPNDYAPGTDLSTMFDGLTISLVTNQANHDGPGGRVAFEPVYSPVYAIETYHTNGLLSFGRTADVDGYLYCTIGSILCNGYAVLEFRFDNPTNFVQIDTMGFSDGPGLLVYDSLGNRIDPTVMGPYTGLSSATILPNGFAATQTLIRPQADIARVVYGGFNGSTTATRLSYQVPEPATLSLVGLGLAGAAFLRRRKRSH